MAKNPLTGIAAILEIKTPLTPLLGDKHRDGVYPLSTDLGWAIAQALTYRQSLLTKYHTLLDDPVATLDAFRPQVVVIGGNARRELITSAKRRSFELTRGEFKDVGVITYHELVAKARILVDALAGAERSK